jgi:hypothetical protein
VLDLKTWLVAHLGLTGFTPRYPQLLMCPCNLDLLDGEADMHVLRTHPRIHINGIIAPNSHCIPTQQFLGTP